MATEYIAPQVAMRIMKELRGLFANPTEGIRVSVSDENISQIHADIDGPVGTPFEGGVFRCKLVLGSEFPQAPPKAHFVTKIFHPNVSKAGEICVNTLKKDWKATHGIQHVLLVIRCLLIVPNAESALNEEAGKLLLERYEDFAARARLMTSIHAKPKKGESKEDNSENEPKPGTEAPTGASGTTTAAPAKQLSAGAVPLKPAPLGVANKTLPAGAGAAKPAAQAKKAMRRL